MADDDLEFDDFDDDEFLAAWNEADREAAGVLREALASELAEPAPEADLDRAARGLEEGAESGRPPFDYFVRACGWYDGRPADRGDLWLDAAAASISPPNDPGTDAEEQAAVFALEHADWVGMVTGLVRRGVGASFDAETAEDDIENCPEVEGDVPDDEGQFGVLELAVSVLTPLWQSLGILDSGAALTPLGRWGVPRALLRAWEHEER
jgi:hypothetical protein